MNPLETLVYDITVLKDPIIYGHMSMQQKAFMALLDTYVNRPRIDPIPGLKYSAATFSCLGQRKELSLRAIAQQENLPAGAINSVLRHTLFSFQKDITQAIIKYYNIRPYA